MNLRKLRVPYVENLDLTDFVQLEQIMELQAAKTFVSVANWPEDFPYIPSTIVMVARNKTHLVIVYHVRGLDIRASVMQDNEMVCGDSCCEFFVSHPFDGTYYNFEINCIGTMKVAKRRSREEYELFRDYELSEIIRYASLERKETLMNGMHSWRVAMCIPYKLIGFTSDTIPSQLSANFYKCADKSDHPHFVSWSPIDTDVPDFHRPDFFGILEF